MWIDENGLKGTIIDPGVTESPGIRLGNGHS